MLESTEFFFDTYIDNLVGNRPGFTVGMSDLLLIATH